MRLLGQRRSYVLPPSNPLHALQPPSALLDNAVSVVAFALLIATWAVGYVALVPADPAPTHRIHIVAQR